MQPPAFFSTSVTACFCVLLGYKKDGTLLKVVHSRSRHSAAVPELSVLRCGFVHISHGESLSGAWHDRTW